MTALPPSPPRPLADDDQQQEDDDGTSLLRDEVNQEHVAKPEHSARFAGILGFATGCGALLAGELMLSGLQSPLADESSLSPQQ